MNFLYSKLSFEKTFLLRLLIVRFLTNLTIQPIYLKEYKTYEGALRRYVVFCFAVISFFQINAKLVFSLEKFVLNYFN